MPFLTILVTVFIFGILVFTHEFFHFAAAKRAGVRVEEFGLGLPPRLVGFFKKNGKWNLIFGPKKIEAESTIYSLNFIPFGGFNKIYGMEGEESLPCKLKKEEVSFRQRSIGARVKIVAAGVAGNFLLAAILFSFGFYFGLPQAIEGEVPTEAKDAGVQIVLINKDSPAEKAEIKLGDKLLTIRSLDSGITKEIKKVSNIQEFTKEHIGKEVILTLKRGDKIIGKEIFLRESSPEGEGPMGVGLAMVARISYPWHTAVLKGFEQTFLVTQAMIKIFFEIVKGALIGKPVPGVQLTGPVGITFLVSDMIELGWIYILNFTAILSLNLAIINLFPFPALDGGHLLLLLAEKIRKAPVRIEVQNLVNQIGFIILIILMLIVTAKDIAKIF